MRILGALLMITWIAIGIFVVGQMDIPVQAAQAQAPTPISDNCEEVATVGLLTVYFCETDHGDLFVNSFGFMTVSE